MKIIRQSCCRQDDYCRADGFMLRIAYFMRIIDCDVLISRNIMRYKKTLVLVFLLLLVVPDLFISASNRTSHGRDFRIFLVAGERLLQGTPLYEGSGVATNVTRPPFFAVVMVPFSLLARVNLPLSQVAWYLFSVALFFISIGIWCRILYEHPCGWLVGKKDHSLFSIPLLIPLVCVSGPLLDNFTQLQSSPLLLFLMTIGIYSLKRKKALHAGLWFGMAAAIKAFPILFILYLLYRKEYKASLSMVLTAAGLSLLPVFQYGIDGYVVLAQNWLSLSLSGGYPIGGLNQSVYAMAGRYLASDPFILMVKRLPAPLPGSPGVFAATCVYRGLAAVCMIALWWLLFRKRYRNIGLEPMPFGNYPHDFLTSYSKFPLSYVFFINLGHLFIG
jgi:hypothetical protein